MHKLHISILAILGVSLLTFLVSLVMFILSGERAALPASPTATEDGVLQMPKDPPQLLIRHDDGWVTTISCSVGMDPTKISTERDVGIADCPHDQLSIYQDPPQP